jgi:hypothetical protein
MKPLFYPRVITSDRELWRVIVKRIRSLFLGIDPYG